MKETINRIIFRAAISFCIGSTSGFFLSMAITTALGTTDMWPLVPEYAAFFSSKPMAYMLQIFFIGLISATFAGCSILFEVERWSFLKQGFVHFFITTCVWFPIAIFCFGLFTYRSAVISTFLSFTGTYAITWGIQYYMCKRNINEINTKLEQLNQNGEF